MNALAIRRVPLDTLAPDPANPRAHPEGNLDAIVASLRRFGQVEPLVVQAGTNRVIAGHGRLAAMKRLGWTEADVVELPVTSLDATALGIALNRSAELAEWEDDILARLLDQLRSENAIEGIGFSEKEIDDLLSDVADAGRGESEEDDAPEAPESPVSRLGDIWLLGEHRLLCGDSTNDEDMARLMDGKKAHLLATDPPYLVNYQGKVRPHNGYDKTKIENDHWDNYTSDEDGERFYEDFLRVALGHCVDRVPVYQWHAATRCGFVASAWKKNGLLVHQQIVWTKPFPVPGHCLFLWQHEPCLFGWKEGMLPEKDRRPPTSARTVWQINNRAENEGNHPTQKPLAIFEQPIEWHTRRGEIVLEPFSGSGTQIIAAENLGRRCYAMELSPQYVDVAVLRWQAKTGRKATLVNGQTWDEVAANRAG